MAVVSDAVAYAEELAVRDEAVERELAAVAAAQRRTDAVRAAASEVASFRRALPGRRELAEGAVREAGQALERRRAEADEARARLEAAELADARADGARDLQAAEDRVAVAARALERLARERAELEREAAAVEERAGALGGEAARVAAELRQLPRLSAAGGTDPAGGSVEHVLEWSSRARAALLVVRGVLAREREGLIRQANELAAAALGEHLSATTVALVRRRIVRALGDS